MKLVEKTNIGLIAGNILLVALLFLSWTVFIPSPVVESELDPLPEPSIRFKYDNQTKYVLLVDLCDLTDVLSKEEMISVVQNITEAQLDMVLGECND